MNIDKEPEVFLQDGEEKTNSVMVKFLRDRKKGEKKFLSKIKAVIDFLPIIGWISSLFHFDQKKDQYQIYIVDNSIIRGEVYSFRNGGDFHDSRGSQTTAPCGMKIEELDKVLFVYNGPFFFSSTIKFISKKYSTAYLPIKNLSEMRKLKDMLIKYNINYGYRPGLEIILLTGLIYGIYLLVS